MASSGPTTTENAATLVDDDDDDDDEELTDDDGPTRVGVICQCGKSSEILDTLAFGGADSSTPDNDSIVGTIADVGLVVETPTTSTEEGGGAGGVEV